MKKSVGIAGAGIIGRLLALKLLNNGWNVTIFDAETKEGEKNCSHTVAGLLSPFAELDSSESIIHSLGMKSLVLWDSILNILNEPVYFQKKEVWYYHIFKILMNWLDLKVI